MVFVLMHVELGAEEKPDPLVYSEFMGGASLCPHHRILNYETGTMSFRLTGKGDTSCVEG